MSLDTLRPFSSYGRAGVGLDKAERDFLAPRCLFNEWLVSMRPLSYMDLQEYQLGDATGPLQSHVVRLLLPAHKLWDS